MILTRTTWPSISNELKKAEAESKKSNKKIERKNFIHSSIVVEETISRIQSGQIGGSDNHIKLILLFDFVSVFMFFFCVCTRIYLSVWYWFVSYAFAKNILSEAVFFLSSSLSYSQFTKDFHSFWHIIWCGMWYVWMSEWCRDSKQYEM